jgi:HAD superfamily hydrolase (TIGR01490 family)
MSVPVAATPRSSYATRGKPRHVGAFFDVDKTLIAENSGSLYLKHRYRLGEIGGRELLKGLSAYLRYKVGILDIETWSRGMMRDFKGRTEEDLSTEGRELFDELMRAVIYPAAPEMIQEHRDQGHVVALVSGAVRYVLEPLAQHLGVDHILCSRLEVKDQRLTGQTVEPLCFREGKIYWLEQFIDDHDVDLARSWFYSDSVTDVPLLSLVGHPVVVNPDPVLYRTAIRRCWPVRFLQKPEPAEVLGEAPGEAPGVQRRARVRAPRA